MRCLCSSSQHLVVAGALAHRDQFVLLGHDVADRIVELLLEAHVAPGDDADQVASPSTTGTPEMLRAGQPQTSPMVVSGPTVKGR